MGLPVDGWCLFLSHLPSTAGVDKQIVETAGQEDIDGGSDSQSS